MTSRRVTPMRGGESEIKGGGNLIISRRKIPGKQNGNQRDKAESRYFRF